MLFTAKLRVVPALVTQLQQNVFFIFCISYLFVNSITYLDNLFKPQNDIQDHYLTNYGAKNGFYSGLLKSLI